MKWTVLSLGQGRERIDKTLVRSYSPAVPTTYTSADALSGGRNGARTKPTVNTPMMIETCVRMLATPSSHHTRSLVDATPHPNQAEPDDSRGTSTTSVYFVRHSPCRTLWGTITSTIFAESDYLSTALIGLLPRSVIHPRLRITTRGWVCSNIHGSYSVTDGASGEDFTTPRWWENTGKPLG